MSILNDKKKPTESVKWLCHYYTQIIRNVSFKFLIKIMITLQYIEKYSYI